MLRLTDHKIWRCECGNEDQERIITASDGEVVCGKCGTVLAHIAEVREESGEQGDSWDEESDLCRKILEECVSKKGWKF